ncbi:MAG: hypothetical protein AAF969_07060 [Bacteroidota bacterium]
MNSIKVISTFLIFSMISCKEQRPQPELQQEIPDHYGPFFGIVPSKKPQLLAPELLASPATEYNGTFSPDGTQFYYTTDMPHNAYITFTEMQADSSWSDPRIAPFSGEYSDFDPLFSPDGNRLYFSSSRPKADNENSKIWYVERKDLAWSDPIRVILTGEEDNEYYSSLTHSGNLYFNIWSKGDIYRAVPSDSTYTVEILPQSINAGGDKGDPFVDPNERYMIFRGYDDTLGRGDLYISFNVEGEWTVPDNLGEPINSSSHEICPWVSQDGKLFIFASDRLETPDKVKALDPIKKINGTHNSGKLNLYYMSTDFIEEMNEKHQAN